MSIKKLLLIAGAFALGGCGISDPANLCRWSGHGDELEVTECFRTEQDVPVTPTGSVVSGDSEDIS
jgi:hypothetical protein